MKWLLALSGNPVFFYALAGVLVAMAAWGGLGWYGKAAAERHLAEYQLAAARVLSDQLAENQRLSDQRALRGAEVSAAYQKGKTDVVAAFQPALADLQRLRALYPDADRLLEPAAPGSGPVPAAAGPAGRPDAAACTGQPGRIIDAADRVVEDLAACGQTQRQLTGLQRWVAEVCAARP